MEKEAPYCSGPWHGHCAPAWRETFGDLEQWLQGNPGVVVVHHPCREVRRIATPRGVIYLKTIYALTDQGLARRELWSYLKWVLRPSRAVAAWRAAVQMSRSGLACPVPILAVRKRVGGYPTDMIATPEIPFADCWDSPPGADPHEVAVAIAKAAADLHRHGFAHGDFILRNLCWDAMAGRIIFLDNDRSWQPPTFLRRHCQRRNLAQMAHSLDKKYNDEKPCRDFLECYADLAGWPNPAGVESLMQVTRRRRRPAQTPHPPAKPL